MGDAELAGQSHLESPAAIGRPRFSFDNPKLELRMFRWFVRSGFKHLFGEARRILVAMRSVRPACAVLAILSEKVRWNETLYGGVRALGRCAGDMEEQMES